MKSYRCTLRPFDCTHYVHKHQCHFENNHIQKCCYAIEENPNFFLHDKELNDKITAEGQKVLEVLKLRENFTDERPREPLPENEPVINRDILRRLRRMAVEQRDKEWSIINKENQMKKGEEPEYTGRDTGFNNNHEFPLDITKTLDAIGFEKKEHRYYGTANNIVPQKSMIEFGVDGNMLSCRNISTLKILFVVDTSIEVGYFIVLLQAFGIIHHRYIYERIRGIRDTFDENHSDNF